MSKDPLFNKIKEVVTDLQYKDELELLVGGILEQFNKVESHLVEAVANKDVKIVRLWTGLEYEAFSVGNFGPHHLLGNQVFLSELLQYLEKLRSFMNTSLNILPEILNETHRASLKNSFNDILRVSRAFEFVNYVALALNGEEPPEEGPRVA